MPEDEDSFGSVDAEDIKGTGKKVSGEMTNTMPLRLVIIDVTVENQSWR